jgi:leucyl/phenylalanyl-tRNA---protein transferase
MADRLRPMRDARAAVIRSDLLISAYTRGWFPMAGEDGVTRWYSPDPRGIIPLEEFHVSSRLARVIRSGRFRIEVDRAFAEVIRACADADRDPDDPGSWISEEIEASYLVLHELGVAHSVEAWEHERLVGGLYGVALGGAFFGESMFHRATDASKVALVALVERLRSRGYVLLDTQWVTDHLKQFGAREVPRSYYLELLDRSLRVHCEFR